MFFLGVAGHRQPELGVELGLVVRVRAHDSSGEVAGPVQPLRQPVLGAPPAECAEAGAIAAPSATIAKIIAFAVAQRGNPYVFGAPGPDAWDCSSLVQAAYAAVGFAIPRTTLTQWPFGVRIPNNQAQPGDLVFFNSGPGTSSVWSSAMAK
ncbi:NlpC/P60 family protein [Actinomadura glauciflava]|uniref:C40 family peptidase n=1 Tax=Actinomadura luteofluorescens TaxID=46163 RepID=UPI002164AE7A|nr:C40 family peptidase [Actinomadura glauciflava]MCR3745281.1 NlpC/P60 family protein [Actinomadura glauciflava]